MEEVNNNTPWTCHKLDEKLNEELLKHFKGERSGFLQVGPKKYFLPAKFGEEKDRYYTFEPRASDVWVASFPRSGTTWTQELVWLVANDLNYQKGAEVPLLERFPFLEFSSCVNDEVMEEFLARAKNEDTRRELKRACGSILEDLNRAKGPRFIKTHLPFSLLPPQLLTCGAKVVYVARNPKDVAVSYYHFHQFIKTLDYIGDFRTFWNFFENNLQLWTPYWDHLNEAWSLRESPNVLFLFYEDLKMDLKGNVKKVAAFLEKQYTDEEIAKLVNHLEFENFQKNPSVNMEILNDLGMLSSYDQRCIRQGKSGGWKDLFTPELDEQANAWIRKNLEKTGLRFPEERLRHLKKNESITQKIMRLPNFDFFGINEDKFGE